MFRSRKLKFFLVLLLVELILIETSFVSISGFTIKQQKPIKKTQRIQRYTHGMVKLFRAKLDRNQLYDEDLLAFALLVLEIIKKRNQSLTPNVYWYSRKG
jgi:hypothetical protein